VYAGYRLGVAGCPPTLLAFFITDAMTRGRSVIMALPLTFDRLGAGRRASGMGRLRLAGGVLSLATAAALALGCSGSQPATPAANATAAASATASATATASTTATPSATPTEVVTAVSATAGQGQRPGSATSPATGSSLSVSAGTITVTIDPPAPVGNGSARKPSHAAFPPPPPKTATVSRSASNIVRVVSPQLGLDHYIEDVGINAKNEMETPEDASYAIGWYRTYDKPGPAGNVVLSAHETWNHMQGPFYNLYLAAEGDEIDLQMASGETYRYRVLTNTRYDVDTMPIGAVIWPSQRGQTAQWITLITCGGRIEYDASGFGEYLDRDVVVAERFD
jgi:hypothetical protein